MGTLGATALVGMGVVGEGGGGYGVPWEEGRGLGEGGVGYWYAGGSYAV